MSKLAARLIKASSLVDWAYQRFDRARALVVTAYASDATLSAYNDLTYGDIAVYNAAEAEFRERLFNWEEDVVARIFPRTPARVLVGGAGGGREAFQLAKRGYYVTAFEPSAGLAGSMADRAAVSGLTVRALVGRYEQLPLTRAPKGGGEVDLAKVEPFDAAILGWSSYSHIRTPKERIAALRGMGNLTSGPVVVSFFGTPPGPSRPTGRMRRLLNTLGRRVPGDAFTAQIGFYHLSSPEEIRREVGAAGLEVVFESFEDGDGKWPWLAARRRAQPAR